MKSIDRIAIGIFYVSPTHSNNATNGLKCPYKDNINYLRFQKTRYSPIGRTEKMMDQDTCTLCKTLAITKDH